MELLTTAEAAQMMRLKPNTLEVWRCKGIGPTFHKIGRSVLYGRAHVEHFINHCQTTETNRSSPLKKYPKKRPSPNLGAGKPTQPVEKKGKRHAKA